MAHNGINETISVGVVTAHQVTERGRVAGGDIFAPEAWGAPSEAVVRDASPLKRLEPGETLEGWMRLAAEAL